MLRLVAFLVVALLAIGPLVFFVANVPQVDKAPEFVYYRIGDALLLASGESEYVRPVQGIPNALLSKTIVSVLDNPVSRAGLATYGYAFTAAVCFLALVAISLAWRTSSAAGAAQAFALIAPWWLGTAAMGVFLAPDYWQAEWLYLAFSVPILFWLRKANATHAHVAIGVWLAVGVLTKVTLLPIGLLLLYFAPARTARLLAVAMASFGISFFAIDLAYMGSVHDALALARFQFAFFIHPNNSASYGSFTEAIAAMPTIPVLICAVLLICALARNEVAAIVCLWCAGYLFLIAKRPHDTSLTSFGISLGFMASALSISYKRQAVALGIALSAGIAGASLDGFSRLRELYNDVSIYRDHARYTTEADAFFSGPGAWYFPNSDWNATIPSQGIGTLGHVGVYGKYTSRPAVAAYRQCCEGFSVVLTQDELRAAQRDGKTIYWTRPAWSSDASLPANREERRVHYRDREWIFGRSHGKGIE